MLLTQREHCKVIWKIWNNLVHCRWRQQVILARWLLVLLFSCGQRPNNVLPTTWGLQLKKSKWKWARRGGTQILWSQSSSGCTVGGQRMARPNTKHTPTHKYSYFILPLRSIDYTCGNVTSREPEMLHSCTEFSTADIFIWPGPTMSKLNFHTVMTSKLINKVHIANCVKALWPCLWLWHNILLILLQTLQL